ncbi:MAG: SMC family ATPase [Anaerolineales bacterium]|nr:SMC family ATPase [Anaerolineales bacterium]
MIPIHLHISGFLSYRDSVDLDFTLLDLACISGANGAGKSSLLDAFTWSLFGEARGKGVDVINLNQDVKAAEVALTFQYEGNVYRVQRTLPRNKSTVLEFQVLDGGDSNQYSVISNGQWRPLTEKSTRETQSRIEQTLQLDYETFINASFFLQGKADQFTQKKASERKAILSSILGLEIWETYKERTAEKRKAIEDEVNTIDGRIAEIDAELSEEDSRKTRLSELENSLKQVSSAREAQEKILDNIKNTTLVLKQQKELVETLEKALNNSRFSLSSLEAKLTEKELEREGYADLARRAKEIEKLYKKWQEVKRELGELENSSFVAREYQSKRQPLVDVINTEKNELEKEKSVLSNQYSVISEQLLVVSNLELEIDSAKKSLAEVEKKIEERESVEGQRNEAKEKLAGLKSENESLRNEMDELKKRIDSLKVADGAECPLCGQPLSESHRKETLNQLEKEGKQKGDTFRANKDEIKEIEEKVASYELRVTSYKNLDNERLQFSNSLSTLSLQLDSINSQKAEWEKNGAKRLKEIEKILESGKYAVDSQKELAKLDKEIAKLGYDISLHESKRKEEAELRAIEEDYLKLDKAKDLSKRIEKEIKELEEERGEKKEEVDTNEKNYEKAAEVLEKSEADAPNINEAESKFYELKEEENRIRDEVGAARQKVDVLATLRTRKTDFETQREELNQNILKHKSLERAFGKDGVPALLIEQALPQIEQKANDLLDRLSDGRMTIRFVTQAEYRDKKRDDLKETLDIQISDSSGSRNYEMYSGGEAFRVNFAIRLALSEILAQRKGARLQTLVIDEGFGSQDALGKQRLVEAINAVKKDFAKTFIITHLDDLKDVFPNRIEVEKSERGSIVKIV